MPVVRDLDDYPSGVSPSDYLVISHSSTENLYRVSVYEVLTTPVAAQQAVGSQQSSFYVVNNTGVVQTISGGTQPLQTMQYGLPEQDPSDEWDPSTNSFINKTAGLYSFSAMVIMSSSASVFDSGYFEMSINLSPSSGFPIVHKKWYSYDGLSIPRYFYLSSIVALQTPGISVSVGFGHSSMDVYRQQDSSDFFCGYKIY